LIRYYRSLPHSCPGSPLLPPFSALLACSQAIEHSFHGEKALDTLCTGLRSKEGKRLNFDMGDFELFGPLMRPENYFDD
jgi:hypothetical protein